VPKPNSRQELTDSFGRPRPARTHAKQVDSPLGPAVRAAHTRGIPTSFRASIAPFSTPYFDLKGRPPRQNRPSPELFLSPSGLISVGRGPL